jgi:aromatic-L-amino-acid decarboxylase
MAQVEPGFLAKSIPDEAPEEGEEWSTISSDYQNIILPGITHWQHPNFYAYFPANATFEGALADLYAASITNPGFNWSVSPSNTELELITLNWMAKLFGLSDDFLTTSKNGGGIILGTASEVAITVAVAARERALHHMESSSRPNGKTSSTSANGLPETETALDPDAAIIASKESHGQSISQQAANDAAVDVAAWRGRATSKLVMYGTTQTHSIGAKAALVLGLNFRAIEVYAKDAYALRGDLLEAALREDAAKGLVPFLLIATVGSTSSGAIDNLGEIRSVGESN